MVSLLEKSRSINQLLESAAGQPVDFGAMARVLSQVIQCNVYVVSRRGKLLGYALGEGAEAEAGIDGAAFPAEHNRKFLAVDRTAANVRQEDARCALHPEGPCAHEASLTTIVPIHGGGERLATLVLQRPHDAFTDEDLILAESGSTVVGMEILRSKTEEADEESRKRAAVQVAIASLSYSELDAMHHIFDELGGSEGLLVASKIADRVGITRSVIVNALRKFESAGVIEARSLGMKGTHIKILNDRLPEELQRLR